MFLYLQALISIFRWGHTCQGLEGTEEGGLVGKACLDEDI